MRRRFSLHVSLIPNCVFSCRQVGIRRTFSTTNQAIIKTHTLMYKDSWTMLRVTSNEAIWFMAWKTQKRRTRPRTPATIWQWGIPLDRSHLSSQVTPVEKGSKINNCKFNRISDYIYFFIMIITFIQSKNWRG